VPGLIEGAHAGAGLGDRFLRHVERTRVLLHLLDGAKASEEITRDKETIEAELRAWNPALLEKPMLLCLSKLDLPDARMNLVELRSRFEDVRGVSAVTREGVAELVYAIATAIATAPAPPRALPEARIDLVPRDAFEIERAADGTFVISGERVERLAAMTNFDSDEAASRFERALERIGVERRLYEMGAKEGDTVRIGSYEFTFS
jgi:GTPase